MGFYQFCTTLICFIYLILPNAFTVQAEGIKLDTQFDGSPCQTNDNRSRPHVQKCVIAKPYAGEFKLRCTPQTELSSNLTLAWYKAETNLPNEVKLISSTDFISFETENQVLKFKAVNPNDTGIYQCRVVTKGQESTVNVQPYTFESVEMKVLPWVKDAHKDLTVIEENPIELTCVVFTKVNVTVTWHVNTTGDVEDYTSSRGRIILQNRNLTTNGFLRINSANLTLDRGNYSCSATSEFGESLTKQSFYVRIKSKYAALWPFLGICAEVIILCTIILIYEKKRDKTELEESDTDQGPETKSSPDHGQDSVRYRK